MKLGFFGVKWASSNTNGIFRNVGVKPAEDFIMPLQTTQIRYPVISRTPEYSATVELTYSRD